MADDPKGIEAEGIEAEDASGEQMSPTVKGAAERYDEPEERTFTAPEGTEIATTVRDGERVEITFPFTTSDEAVIEVLAGLANDPDHPVQEG